MYCMKCGKEIGENQVFCPDCLAVMDRYPVKRGAKVLIPNRPEPVQVKKAAPRKKTLSPEEKIARLQKAIQVLSVSLAAVVLALILSIALLADALSSDTQGNAIGQNYSTVDHGAAEH